MYILKCYVSANGEQQLTWWLNTHLIKTTTRPTFGRRGLLWGINLRLRRDGNFREGKGDTGTYYQKGAYRIIEGNTILEGIGLSGLRKTRHYSALTAATCGGCVEIQSDLSGTEPDSVSWVWFRQGEYPLMVGCHWVGLHLADCRCQITRKPNEEDGWSRHYGCY